MSEIKEDTIETKEVTKFDAADWVDKQIDAIKKKFEKNYALSRLPSRFRLEYPAELRDR
jgi:hypothetical protein